jgi:hypothetical protein
MFIKHGDGKIVSVIDEKELSDEQKESAKKSLEQVKQSNTDTSQQKKSGS